MIFRYRLYPIFAALIAAVAFSSCKEEISTIGSAYVPDSVVLGAHSFRDSAIRIEPIIKNTISVYDRNYNLTFSSPFLFFGNSSADGLQAWTIIKVPFLHDSVGTITDDSLKLTMSSPYFLGTDRSATTIGFSVYVLNPTKSSTAITSLSSADLMGTPVATYSGTVLPDSLLTVTLQLDPATIIPLLKTASLALVIVPDNMSAVRAFASNENGSDGAKPTMIFKASDANGTHFSTRIPEYDYAVLSEAFTPPAGTIEIRGAVAKRERITLNIKEIRESLALNPFVSINAANLEFTYDPSFTLRGSSPADSSYPQLIYRVDTLIVDTVAGFASYADPSTPNVLRYSVQSYIEYALRHNIDSVVFEIWVGITGRTFEGTGAGVDDYNINRWVLYGSDAADQTKRPRLTLLYSYLK